MTRDNKSPARIHAILAREAAKAVVFSRGPSNKTAILEWNLQTDTGSSLASGSTGASIHAV